MEVLTAEELRIIGSLIEKEATTPEQYPLTMNALLLACNQTSNRNPVVSYTPFTVEPAIAHLRELGLARVVHSPSNRSAKYRHVVDEAWGLTPGELAVLAILALRGPQTVNEIKTRSERYPGVEELGGVDAVLDRLATRYDLPMVVHIERQPGQREDRWAHLLAGEVVSVPESSPGPSRTNATAERVTALETEVGALDTQVATLTEEVRQLRHSLDELRDLLT